MSFFSSSNINKTSYIDHLSKDFTCQFFVAIHPCSLHRREQLFAYHRCRGSRSEIEQERCTFRRLLRSSAFLRVCIQFHLQRTSEDEEARNEKMGKREGVLYFARGLVYLIGEVYY